MRLSQGVIERQSLFRRGPRLGRGFAVRYRCRSGIRPRIVKVSQAYISHGILWVLLYGSVEIVLCLFHALGRALVPVITPLEVELESLGIVCPTFCDLVLLLPGQ